MTGENGDLEEAISLSIESIKIDIKAGLGASLGRSLITLGDAWEQKRDERYVHYFKNGIFLLKLYKMDYLYHDVISKMMLQENARERGTTASRIIIDGIRHELGLDD